MAEPNFGNRTLYQGDNLDFLRGMNSESVDLIAADPPFNKGVTAFEGVTAAGQNVSYSDVWTWGDAQDAWTQSIQRDHPQPLCRDTDGLRRRRGGHGRVPVLALGVRVLKMRRILKPTGSLYLHIDHTAHAWTKAMLDGIFGRANCRNEIVWWYYNVAVTSKGFFGRKRDTILRYAQADGMLGQGCAWASRHAE